MTVTKEHWTYITDLRVVIFFVGLGLNVEENRVPPDKKHTNEICFKSITTMI